MRFRARRWLGMAALSIGLSLGVGCSGDQQDDDDGVAADNQAADDNAGDGNAAGADDNGGGNAAAADDNAGDSGGGEATADDKGGGGNATENDLQEIITEMNGQQADGSAPAAGGDSPDAKALQQDAAGATPPANSAAAAAPANNAKGAAPANAAGAKAAAPSEASNPPPFQPGGTPAAQGLPEPGSKMAYVVEKGDTLAKISQKIYGSNSRWQEMATLSGISNPSRIFPGDLVYYTLDDSAVAFAKAYDSVQRSEEQVKPGDTLATISQRIYGSTTAWRSIWRHNDKIDNPDIVTPGTTVYYVPKGALQAAVQKAKAELVALATKTHKVKKITDISVSSTKTNNTTPNHSQRLLNKLMLNNNGIVTDLGLHSGAMIAVGSHS